MARCSCGAPAPALEGWGEWHIVTDLDVPRIVDLLTGELDHAHCDAGCRLNVRASVVFQDSETGRLYLAPGDLVGPAELPAGIPEDMADRTETVAGLDALRDLVGELVNQRLRVFLPVITSPDGTDYLGEKWRLFTAPVIAALAVALSGRVPGIRFLIKEGVRTQAEIEGFFASRQAGIWISMLIDWTNGEGVGSFEEDLSEYVDRTPLIGDPLQFVDSLDELQRPADDELASMDAYRREAFRASLYAKLGQPNPHADRWALTWLWWEVRVRLAGAGGVAEVPELAVSVERLRDTVPPDSARFAGAELLNHTITANRDDSTGVPDIESVMTHVQAVFHETGFDEQLVSIYDGTRLHNPVEEIADLIVDALRIEDLDPAAAIITAKAMAQTLVEARRVDDLSRVVDAMRAIAPPVEVSLWW